MNFRIATLLCLSLCIIIITMNSSVFAARCSVRNVTYTYPSTATPSQQIDIATSVAGSCASNGEDYYAVRVDLIDQTSNLTISSTDTPIGYNASMFNVTAHNRVTTPAANMTWPLQIHLYVIRAGGTNGANLLDYQNSTNVAIQVGATAIPEFHLNLGLEVSIVLGAVTLMLKRKLIS